MESAHAPQIVDVFEAKQLEEYLQEVDYRKMQLHYLPGEFALEFINFIKLVNGPRGEENKSPVIHMDMLDQLPKNGDKLFVSFRGSAKTSVLHEYMILYLAVYGEFKNFGPVDVGMYVSDTIDNGIKSMRQQLDFRYDNSDFLQHYVPQKSTTEVRWEFVNLNGHKTCFRGFGASTGVRGFKEYGKRPVWLGMDDLMSDKNAESPTIIKDIENIVYKAARQAMHPARRMIIWTGTPFNKKDPLYSAAGSGGWITRTYPICEKFPCTKEEFIGAWEDRFTYDFVKAEYDKLHANGKLEAFNQELMLRITSDEDRLVLDSEIKWYKREHLLRNKGFYNFYITTDWATSENQGADFSVTMVWAYNSNGDWFLVDLEVERQLMNKNVDTVFRFAQQYRPQQVGIEISGQQKGFIPWVQQEMMTRNIWFNLASQNNDNKPGIRPLTDKIQRFNLVVPWFKAGKMHFPIELKETKAMKEVVDELQFATKKGFKSKHDDTNDGVSQLSSLFTWKPSSDTPMKQNDDGIYEDDDEDQETSALTSYVV